MEYAIDKLCRMAGVSSRTLRHYHSIGLLNPLRVSGNGVRVYGRAEVDRLQQILFYRALGVELKEIGRILDGPDFDPETALRAHLAQLLARRAQLDSLITTVVNTIEHREEGKPMSDSDKFRGFKEKLVEENERQYGREIRQKYGEATVEASNAKLMNLTEEAYSQMEAINRELLARLEAAVKAGEPPHGPEGRALAQLHRRWLSYTWPQYTLEAHRGLSDMYVQDPRFTQYYDSTTPGCAQFLRDAVHGLE